MSSVFKWLRNGLAVLIGLSWGDEGKGETLYRLILLLDLDFIVRWHGGPNAGHTVVFESKKIVLKQLPTGILVPRVRSFCGCDMVIDPVKLLEEIKSVEEIGVVVSPERLMIDGRTAVITGLHKRIEELMEESAGSNAIGTTHRGIGPTYASVANRLDVCFYDLIDRKRLHERFAYVVEQARLIYKLKISKRREKVWFNELVRAGAVLLPFVGDVSAEVEKLLKEGKRGAAEGAQGTLLDVRHGTLPYVTSSHSLAGSAAAGIGIGPKHLGTVIGIIKAYVTRVGNGPFPTKEKGEIGQHMQRVGDERGSVTKRLRDCGSASAPDARYAIRKNGVDVLYLTKLDILTGLEQIPVTVRYILGHKFFNEAPADPALWEKVEPVDVMMPGWSEDISNCRKFEDLPINAQNYVLKLEELFGVPIVFIGVGEDEHQQIIRDISIDPAQTELGIS